MTLQEEVTELVGLNKSMTCCRSLPQSERRDQMILKIQQSLDLTPEYGPSRLDILNLLKNRVSLLEEEISDLQKYVKWSDLTDEISESSSAWKRFSLRKQRAELKL